MILHYLKIAQRGWLRHRMYSVITLFSLLLGITSALLISVFVVNEWSYDRHYANKERIYRVVTRVGGPDADAIAKIPAPWGDAMRTEFPEVENVTRIALASQVLMESPTVKRYDQDGIFADPSVLEIFSFDWLHGDKSSALKDPMDVVITRSLARAYFGEENVVGKTLRVDGKETLRITGVLADVPLQSHFTFSYIRSIGSYRADALSHWKWTQFYTYVLVRPDAGITEIPERLRSVIDKNLPAVDRGKYYPYLQPLTSIHLHSHLFREMSANGNITTVWTFAAIALVIVLIAGVNYTSLVISRASERSREVGLRKVVGSPRGQLIRQFLGESVAMSVLSTAMALLLAELLLPLLNQWGGLSIDTESLHRPVFLLATVMFALMLGGMAGFYPALMLSRFKPVDALKGSLRLSKNLRFRKLMVAVQFAISIVLLISTAVIHSQLDFVSSQDPGFSRDQLVTIPLGQGPIVGKQDAFRSELLRIPNVRHATFSANLLGGGDWGIPADAEGWPSGETPSIRQLIVDESFITAYGMTLASGRDFSTSFPSDRKNAFIINEEAARVLQWNEPLGKTITMPAIDRSGSVIGVLKDFHFRSFHEKIEPLMMYIQTDWVLFVTVKIGSGSVPETLRQIESAWSRFDPVQPFTCSFVDERFEALYHAEQRSVKILTAFSMIAVAISCLGLFGLAAYAVTQRTKEVGIRKVLGATARDITVLLSSEMLWVVLLANAVAWPVAYWTSTSWLEQFAYRTGLSWMLFAVSGTAVLLLAMGTVLVHAIRATLSDPVKALRIE